MAVGATFPVCSNHDDRDTCTCIRCRSPDANKELYEWFRW